MFSNTLKSALVQQHLVSLGHDPLSWRVPISISRLAKLHKVSPNDSKNKKFCLLRSSGVVTYIGLSECFASFVARLQ